MSLFLRSHWPCISASTGKVLQVLALHVQEGRTTPCIALSPSAQLESIHLFGQQGICAGPTALLAAGLQWQAWFLWPALQLNEF